MTEKQRKEGEYSLKYHQRQQKSLSTTGSMEEKGFSPKTQKCLVQEWVEKDYLDSFLANQTSLDRNQSFKKLLTEQGSFRSERLEESNGQDIFSGFSKDDKSGRSKENTIRLNFRTDNAFITVAEQETKQENAKQLRENLLKQIEEKKRNQELSKRQEREQEMHDQRRVVREVQAMNDKHEMQTQEEKEKEQRAKLKQDSVAEAWSQAKSESMKRKASINRRVVDSIPVDQDRSTNTTMEAVNMEAEIKKLQAIITQERLTMQHQLRDSLLSLQEGLGSQLNALKNKTDSLETRSVLSSLELNHLQQRLKKAQNAPSQGFHSAPRVITQRIRSARNANKKDGDLSPWELGFTDYPYLFQQANSKCFLLTSLTPAHIKHLDCSIIWTVQMPLLKNLCIAFPMGLYCLENNLINKL
eukprot:g3380.t1